MMGSSSNLFCPRSDYLDLGEHFEARRYTTSSAQEPPTVCGPGRISVYGYSGAASISAVASAKSDGDRGCVGYAGSWTVVDVGARLQRRVRWHQ